jgi:hypothetical protein
VNWEGTQATTECQRNADCCCSEGHADGVVPVAAVKIVSGFTTTVLMVRLRVFGRAGAGQQESCAAEGRDDPNAHFVGSLTPVRALQ